MTYDLTGLYQQAATLLEQKPQTGLVTLSHTLGVERHTLESAFQLSVGKSFRGFRRELLCRKAMELLASKPGVPIKEIAFLLGYKSERAFARFIRNSFGCCACELRSELRRTYGRARKGTAKYRLPGRMRMRRPDRLIMPFR